MSHTPDPRADDVSTTDYCKLLPRQRYTHEARGQILLLPSSGLVVVPFTEHTGGWDVVVIDGHGSYPVGGHHLCVGDAEIETAIELALGEPVPTRFVHNRVEAEALPDGTAILTRDGGSLRKSSDEAGTLWTGFLKAPVRTADLHEALFPATVRGPVQTKESSHV
ncbi:hypothetical protein ACQCSX_21960 (plasmid) [Pseudarthrobacter sp. P1]|uniref:hypothetical protein n=1 Tax=Pseudarthrobacter sp. P1 TaxID=3418418 RepID=UPI003CF48C1B